MSEDFDSENILNADGNSNLDGYSGSTVTTYNADGAGFVGNNTVVSSANFSGDYQKSLVVSANYTGGTDNISGDTNATTYVLSGAEWYNREWRRIKAETGWSDQQVTDRMSEIIWNNNYQVLITDIDNSKTPEEREQKIKDHQPELDAYKVSGIKVDKQYLRNTQGMPGNSKVTTLISKFKEMINTPLEIPPHENIMIARQLTEEEIAAGCIMIKTRFGQELLIDNQGRFLEGEEERLQKLLEKIQGREELFAKYVEAINENDVLLLAMGGRESGIGLNKVTNRSLRIIDEGASKATNIFGLNVDKTMKASELRKVAESKGWTKVKTETGPEKWLDENGIDRITIKKGSPRTPGSETPHVEIKDASGNRIDPLGNSVNRKSPDNHTPIEFDIE